MKRPRACADRRVVRQRRPILTRFAMPAAMRSQTRARHAGNPGMVGTSLTHGRCGPYVPGAKPVQGFLARVEIRR
jgi:hypothetical protein